MKKLTISAALAACLVTGTVGAIAIAGDEGLPATTEAEKTPSAPAPLPGEKTVGGVRPEAKAAFKVLRTSQRIVDKPDSTLSSQIANQNIDPGSLRLVVPSANKSSRFYVGTTAGGTVCLINGSGSGGCLPAEAAAQDGTIGTSECGPIAGHNRVAVYGLAPDGVDEIQLTSNGGTSDTVAVESNGWLHISSIAADTRPATASWTDSAGKAHRLSISYSPDVGGGC